MRSPPDHHRACASATDVFDSLPQAERTPERMAELERRERHHITVVHGPAG